jgi:hypothetical protein
MATDKDPHVKKVMNYLMEISSPQTELTYLCQSMRWKMNFMDKFAEGGLFETIVTVEFDFKKVKKILNESFVAKQKKMGKLVASFKMLRNIYLSFP